MNKKIDKEFITEKMLELANAAIDDSLQDWQQSVKIIVPIQIHEVIKHIAEQTDKDLDEVYTDMATTNIKRQIQETVSSFKLNKVENKEKENVNIDNGLGELTDKFSQFTNLMDSFKQLEKQLSSIDLNILDIGGQEKDK